MNREINNVQDGIMSAVWKYFPLLIPIHKTAICFCKFNISIHRDCSMYCKARLLSWYNFLSFVMRIVLTGTLKFCVAENGSLLVSCHNT